MVVDAEQASEPVPEHGGKIRNWERHWPRSDFLFKNG